MENKESYKNKARLMKQLRKANTEMEQSLKSTVFWQKAFFFLYS
tara:strand:- start:935 stop:1066 length:132 start_codon:yes stop_codon:yes gene_type:complete